MIAVRSARLPCSPPCPCRTASVAPIAPGASGSAWTPTGRSRSCCRGARRSATPTRRCASSGRGSSAASAPSPAPPPRSGREPGTVPYLGETLRLVPEPGRDARAPPRRRRCSSRPATRARRSSAGTGARRTLEIAPRLDAATARAGTSYTGLTIRAQSTRWASLLLVGRDVVQLAAAARAARDPRLRGRARGRPHRGHGPLAALLAAARFALAATGARTRRG